jgi:hypothetical protein
VLKVRHIYILDYLDSFSPEANIISVLIDMLGSMLNIKVFQFQVNGAFTVLPYMEVPDGIKLLTGYNCVPSLKLILD